MFSWIDRHINSLVFEFFVSQVGIYPVGTVVLLSTNGLAVVADVSKKPLEPLFVIFKSDTGVDIKIIEKINEELINLLKALNF